MITEIRMPALNANEEAAKLIRWRVSDGTKVAKGDALCDVETTKAAVEIAADIDGFVVRVAQEGDNVGVGAVIGLIKLDAKLDHSAFLPTKSDDKKRSEQRKWTKKAFIVARRIGVDIEALSARSPDKTIGEDDVLAAGVSEQASASAVTLDPLRPPTGNYHRILLLGGAGGAGQLALDSISRSSTMFAVGILDKNPASHGKLVHGVPILGSIERLKALMSANAFDGAILLFTDDVNERAEQFLQLSGMGVPFTNLIDPTVQVRSNVKMGRGNLIMGNCYFATGTEIGDNNFFASHTVIEHQSKVGSHCTFGPRCTTSGRVAIGDRVKFGMNVGIEPYLNVGDRCVVASGSILTASVPAGTAIKAKATQVARLT